MLIPILAEAGNRACHDGKVLFRSQYKNDLARTLALTAPAGTSSG
jgi:hypothetical protein